ncbi:transmembrane protein 272-like isoform X2 [Betta splendens]|uniref:Transmembrane protein 272-like isoform X2 n=1 Tax=Betta splendens TaxID=158456 RepID=A0A8M1HBX0_BETSP|nr:transmembrane protein 272-like isoform X2 [Betta splendens]
MSNVGLLRQRPNTPTPSLPVPVLRSLYLNECPRQRYIPIYLIVGGVFGLVIALLSCLPCTQREEDDSNPDPPGCLYSTWTSLTKLFLFCWFIAGNVWIYSIYQPDYVKNPASPELYCNKTLYLFAFWVTTMGYIFAGLSFVLGLCFMLCSCLCRLAVSDDDV